MNNFQNKYRTKTIRLKSWDYTNPHWYFVTICTKDHKSYFGEIQNEKMTLNEIGMIAEEELLKTQELREYVELDEYIIMPNHIHAIIIINPSESNVETRCSVSLPREFSKPIAKSLSTIINLFKGSVTKRCKKRNQIFHWQPRFFDRIIRNEIELYNIRKYIQQNPMKWELEKKTPENVNL